MSNKLGWFGVRERTEVALIDALRSVGLTMPRDQTPSEGFRIARCARHATAVMLGWEYTHVHQWAANVSARLEATCVSFLILEHAWDYTVHHAGTSIAAMGWYPEEAPSLRGDVTSAATYIGVPLTVMRRYCDATQDYLRLPEKARDERDVRAFPDDEFDIGSDWVHCDFAKRVGFEYSEPGAGQVIRIMR